MIDILRTQENTPAQTGPIGLVTELLATMTARAMAAESALEKAETATHDWFDRYTKVKGQMEEAEASLRAQCKENREIMEEKDLLCKQLETLKNEIEELKRHNESLDADRLEWIKAYNQEKYAPKPDDLREKLVEYIEKMQGGQPNE